jgi:hypothetical protein
MTCLRIERYGSDFITNLLYISTFNSRIFALGLRSAWVFMCFEFFWEPLMIISLNSITRFIFSLVIINALFFL